MKKFLGFCGLLALLAAGSRADTLFPGPVIVVTPMALKFGAADARRALTNTFLVENVGRGTLVGKVKVKAPFRVLDGGSYALKANEAQVVTLVYAPTNSVSITNAVEFSGGGGCTASAIGKPLK